MYVVAIGWMYVVVMASVAEAMSPQGTVLGALMTFIGWGLLPCALVLYILGTPARKRRLREQAAQEAHHAQHLSPSPALRDRSESATAATAQDAEHTQGESTSNQAVSRD